MGEDCQHEDAYWDSCQQLDTASQRIAALEAELAAERERAEELFQVASQTFAALVKLERGVVIGMWSTNNPQSVVCHVDAVAQQLADERTRADMAEQRLSQEQEAMHADLRILLEVLGLPSGAQPKSPHEVMLGAVEEVRKRTAELATERTARRDAEAKAAAGHEANMLLDRKINELLSRGVRLETKLSAAEARETELLSEANTLNAELVRVRTKLADEAGGNEWMEIARQNQRNTDYYRGLVVRTGQVFGIAARTQDDGGICEDVLCAKVPELVEQVVAQVVVLREALEECRPYIEYHTKFANPAQFGERSVHQIKHSVDEVLSQPSPAAERVRALIDAAIRWAEARNRCLETCHGAQSLAGYGQASDELEAAVQAVEE